MSNNPHDKLFKAVFSEVDNAIAHFETTLPGVLVAALDLPRAEHVPGSWVDEALQEHHSDLLFTIPLRQRGGDDRSGGAGGALLYVLFEHQSSVRPFMALKLQRYVTRVLDGWSRGHPGEALPPLIPLVLYHGDSAWSAPLELEELFDLGELDPVVGAALRPYLPRLRYVLQEVPSDPAAVRAAPGIVRLTLRVLKLGRSPELRARLLEWQEDFLVEKGKGARGLRHAELLVKYVLVVNEEVTPEDLAEALRPMGTEAQNIPKPYALRMREEGRQEGRQEGQQEGRRASQLEIARRLLAEGMSPTKVAELTDLPLAEVQTLSH